MVQKKKQERKMAKKKQVMVVILEHINRKIKEMTEEAKKDLDDAFEKLQKGEIVGEKFKSAEVKIRFPKKIYQVGLRYKL